MSNVQKGRKIKGSNNMKGGFFTGNFTKHGQNVKICDENQIKDRDALF